MIIVNWGSSKMRYNALKDLMLAGGAYRTRTDHLNTASVTL